MDDLNHARACPACGTEESRLQSISREPWTVVACERCDFVYLKNPPDVSAFAGEFSWDKSTEVEAKRRKQSQPIIQWIDQKTRWRLHMFTRPESRTFLQRLVPSGNVLDLGCGDGRHAMALPEHYTPFGVEIAPVLAEMADTAFSSRGGHCSSADSLAGIQSFDDGFFDGAILNSYLEHDPRPFEVLTALRPKMRSGASVVVKVPNFGSWNAAVMGARWCGVRLPDHVNYFTWKSLSQMGERAGYTVGGLPSANLPTNDNMWAIMTA